MFKGLNDDTFHTERHSTARVYIKMCSILTIYQHTLYRIKDQHDERWQFCKEHEEKWTLLLCLQKKYALEQTLLPTVQKCTPKLRLELTNTAILLFNYMSKEMEL